MRSADDFRFVIVSRSGDDIVLILVTARQTGMKRIPFFLASCDKIRIGEFMPDRFQNFRLYAIFTTAAFLSAIAFFRTSRRNFDFFIVRAAARTYRYIPSRNANRYALYSLVPNKLVLRVLPYNYVRADLRFLFRSVDNPRTSFA